MRRSTVLLATLCLFGLGAAVRPVSSSAAGPPVSGTIACSLDGFLAFRPYLPLVLFSPPLNKPIRLVSSHISGACDSSGVVGGVTPITETEVQLRGALAAGSTCLDLESAVSLLKTKMKVRWKGVRNGHLVTVATSHALVTSGSYDSGSNAFVLTTAPITKGAFLGSTLTWRFAWGDFDDHHRICTTLDAAYSGFSSANGLPWTLEVP
jgi:hypothetical protein